MHNPARETRKFKAPNEEIRACFLRCDTSNKPDNYTVPNPEGDMTASQNHDVRKSIMFNPTDADYRRQPLF